uniref:Rhomboid domain-containing protein n=1 Tax=Macrostomum lignano TaxID=282301 RepID=A0A1I8GEZ3_9PLAT
YTKKSEVSRSKRVINSFIESMTPAAQKKLRKEKIQAAQAGEPIPEESYLEAYNCRPPPLFIPLFYPFGSSSSSTRLSCPMDPIPLVFCPSLRQEAWRFVSYMFLHNGYHHVVFNTILSFLLGIPLECVHKAWRVGPVFLIGVTIGAMASSIADHNTMLIGASGGVYALFGAHYATVLMNWEELQDDWLDIRANPLKFLLSGIMRLVYLTLLLILDFGISFYGRYSGTQTLPVSVAAHVGGLLAGFFAGVPILRNIDKKPWESKVSIVCWVVLALHVSFRRVFWNIFYKNYPAADSIVCSNTALADSLG